MSGGTGDGRRRGNACAGIMPPLMERASAYGSRKSSAGESGGQCRPHQRTAVQDVVAESGALVLAGDLEA